MIRQLKISFAGSFQARLATETDPTDSSPRDPYGTYGAKAQGWTFAYQEAPFDRIIRLSKPVELRTALMDPWRDAVVTRIDEDSGAGFRQVPVDVLMGGVVSFGNAKFDTSAGGGAMTQEALVNFKLSMGGNLLTADPVSAPRLVGLDGVDHSAWKTEYEAKKRAKMRGVTLDAVRAKVLADYFFETYSGFFAMREQSKPAKLRGVAFSKSASASILYRLDSPASSKYNWTFQAAFYRFDGDTLSGQIDGTILATHV